ncbi:AAA family ATPase [Solibacillus sp. FSL W7-1464]|uniref:AAA family ATPase n=1 Tax=Solibacillus sp. FSL W7-1464 TaxID=2921706 RepID=UPI0030FB5332
MKRLAIITVGKTHSGKSTFAHALEKQLSNSFIMDQDNHAEFINTHYKKLLPNQGTNLLKNSLSKLIVEYAKEHTDFHFIICNSNRNIKGRKHLLEEVFPAEAFVRILVHFDISDDELHSRVKKSQRSTNIFRGRITNFEELLLRQQAESSEIDIVDPTVHEADRLFIINNNNDIEKVIHSIVLIAQTSL